MVEGGYYIKARSIQGSEIAHKPPHVREIWDWLIKEANHKDAKKIKRGQTMRSLRDIQEGLCWYVGYRKEVYSKSKCEMAMKWLRNDGMITTTKTTRGMLITVCNYDTYQDPTSYETNSEKSTKQTINQQPCDTINKNNKNKKKEKNIIPVPEKSNDFTEEREILNSVYSLFDPKIIPKKEKGKDKWLDEIRKLKNIDKYSSKEIIDVITFGRTDSFWMTNFYSIPALRKKSDGVSKFYKIKAKMDSGGSFKPKETPPKIISKEANYYDKKQSF